MKVNRTRESIPFGMNIRQAAHKAAFGNMPGALQRYSTFREDVHRKEKSSNPLDELEDLDESESDSVSHSSSDDSGCDGLDSLDVKEVGGAGPSRKTSRRPSKLGNRKLLTGPLAYSKEPP